MAKKPVPAPEAEPDTRQLGEAAKVLAEQAAALGLQSEAGESVDALAARVLKAQAAKDEADKAAYEAARKVPVMLLRDAWPVADEKHFAGETIDVPLDMARAWIAAGVAVNGAAL